ncbi:unnamed protein product [Acanthoscelides obtectus]|uniref:Cyclin N-terminal domain-containing protein n=1 Tax=Acanthoscelides obtectus TaxID=200917 RepID=A0A9P0JY63_ACAOB|nr:unnamed protein product [Acanthoscelides obtectus]CAK1646167.1 Cyclin-A1 [Acanthoscelides obtectus]
MIHIFLQPLGASNQLNVNVDCKIKSKNENGCAVKKENQKNLDNPIVPVAQFEAFKVYEDDSFDERMARIDEKLKQMAKKNGIIDAYKGTAEDRFLSKTEAAAIIKKKREEQDAARKNLELLRSQGSSPMSVGKPNDENMAEMDDDSLFWGRKTVKDVFFDMEEYREMIYKYLREHELKHRPKSGYMKKQPDVTSNMRTILVDWLVEVAEEYRLTTETLYLAVNFIDRFLSYMSVVRAKLQLVGTAAMFLAS